VTLKLSGLICLEPRIRGPLDRRHSTPPGTIHRRGRRDPYPAAQPAADRPGQHLMAAFWPT
jgi:hypothetical protein